METTSDVKMKKCSKCGRELPLSEFYRNRSTKDGYMDRCKKCHDEDVRNSKARRKAVIAAKTGYAAPEPPKVTSSDSATVERKVLNGAAYKVYAHPELARF